MMIAVFWENPAVVGSILAIPATALGYLGYRRSRKLDAVTEQSGVATARLGEVGQVIDGLNRVITAVQSDNATLRKDLDEIRIRLDAVESGNDDLRSKNRELERQIGLLHVENEALKKENQELKERVVGLEKANGS